MTCPSRSASSWPGLRDVARLRRSRPAGDSLPSLSACRSISDWRMLSPAVTGVSVLMSSSASLIARFVSTSTVCSSCASLCSRMVSLVASSPRMRRASAISDSAVESPSLRFSSEA